MGKKVFSKALHYFQMRKEIEIEDDCILILW